MSRQEPAGRRLGGRATASVEHRRCVHRSPARQGRPAVQAARTCKPCEGSSYGLRRAQPPASSTHPRFGDGPTRPRRRPRGWRRARPPVGMCDHLHDRQSRPGPRTRPSRVGTREPLERMLKERGRKSRPRSRTCSWTRPSSPRSPATTTSPPPYRRALSSMSTTPARCAAGRAHPSPGASTSLRGRHASPTCRAPPPEGRRRSRPGA